MTNRKNPLSPLKNPSFQIYFYAQLFSNIGSFMHSMALSWLIYKLTGSATFLGILSLAEQIPAFFLAPLAGILCERKSIKRTLLITQSSLCFFTAAIAALSYFPEHLNYWSIFGIVLCIGVVNGFDIISRSFLLSHINHQKDLGSTIALNSLLQNMARIVGPLCAGIVIKFMGENLCFILNSLSYLPFIIGLQYIKLQPTLVTDKKNISIASFFEDLKESYHYVRNHTGLKKSFLLVYTSCFFSFSYMILMPVYVQSIHGGDSRLLGFFMSLLGMGAVSGALLLGSRSSTDGLHKTIVLSYLIFAFSGLIYGLTSERIVAYAVLPMMGFSMVYHMSSANTLIQAQTKHHIRGRIMSLYTMAHSGVFPIGSLVTGKLADLLGPKNASITFSSFSVAFAVFFYLSHKKWGEEVHIEKTEITMDQTTGTLLARVPMNKEN